MSTKLSKSVRLPLALGIAAMVTMTIPAFASTFVDQAEQLANLRAEVTKLASELRDEQSNFQNRVRSLENQRSDLELQLRRERTQLDNLNSQITEMEKELLPAAQQDELSAAIVTHAEQLRLSVRASLPYRHSDRIAAIDEITSSMKDKSISAQQAATRLWAVAEDERRLNQENILDKQNITVNGESLLVETARLGMVAMYYLQPNGNVGAARKDDAQWSWVAITDPTEQEQVQLLFLNLKKGIRTGLYTLPYAMVNP